jgi:hypothetical protein
MSAKSERPKNRRVKLVGGGTRKTRSRASESGGSLKSQRRKLRQELKKEKRNLTVAQRKVIKEQIASLLAQKDGR